MPPSFCPPTTIGAKQRAGRVGEDGLWFFCRVDCWPFTVSGVPFNWSSNSVSHHNAHISAKQAAVTGGFPGCLYLEFLLLVIGLIFFCFSVASNKSC